MVMLMVVVMVIDGQKRKQLMRREVHCSMQSAV